MQNRARQSLIFVAVVNCSSAANLSKVFQWQTFTSNPSVFIFRCLFKNKRGVSRDLLQHWSRNASTWSFSSGFEFLVILHTFVLLVKNYFKASFLFYSKKALQLKPSVTKGENTQVFDLSREIAFNLSLIYRSADFSGSSTDVARLYLDRYVTI